MRRKCIFLCIFLCSIQSQEIYAQVFEFPDEHAINFRNGFYLDIDEFKLNQPSIPITGKLLANIENDHVFKLKRFKFLQDDSLYTVAVKKIMFICLDGNVYINHKFARKSEDENSHAYFYKIHRVGYFCNYFRHNFTDKGLHAARKGEVIAQMIIPAFKLNLYGVRGTAPDQEYILSLIDGKVYNIKKSAKRLKLLLKKDPYFANKKIKNKDLIIYLGQYNKRNSFNFGRPIITSN